MSKKLLCTLMSCSLVLSTLSFTPRTTIAQPKLVTGEYVQLEQSDGTVDLAIANEERLIEMLKKTGKIAANASEEEALKALKEYLQPMAKEYAKDPSQLNKQEKLALGKIKEENKKNGSSKDNNKFPGTKPRTWDGSVTKDRILVLLEDFKDYKHSQITPQETDMYYKDYAQKHYQDMIFGNNGYVGPNGELLMSMKQFYEQQSGGSYTIEGTVLGWYTAANGAAYYGADSATSHNINAKYFVYEALISAAKDKGVNLADYDLEDPYDIDEDGDINEPDGIIDHLMVVHAGVGQEAGGGVLGDDSIWSHSSRLANLPVAIPGATSNSSNFGGKLAAWAYTIMPEDGASGVFCHEFGHDLGLPDEYDTIYSGAGEPIEYWSLMSSGSWAGKVPGTEPTGFSPYGKLYFQDTYGGNWMHGATIDTKDIPKSGLKYVLDQAAIKGNNNDYVKVLLPDKAHDINKPVSGSYEYYGGKGRDGEAYKTSMSTNLDLAGKSSVKLTFKTWYDIEEYWDFASIQVREQGSNVWTALPGNITTTKRDPQAIVKVANGITGTSDGWVDAEFDLSAYSGKKMELKFEYETDPYSFGQGFYVDNIVVTADGNIIFSDDVEGTPKFTLNGFTRDTGKVLAANYYLLEWRNNKGSDAGLAHIKRGNSLMSYDPGLVVWYADDFYSDNWTGIHPGEGYLGIVDADQSINKWHYVDNSKPDLVAATRYQMHDAAFSQRKTAEMLLDYANINKRIITDNITKSNHIFDDSNSYLNPLLPDAGRIIPKLGLTITVNGEANDRSQGTIMLKVK